MRRALALARRGFTTPNPMVGCVLVRDGQIVGEGFHRLAGEPHAEANALRMAGEAARGATAYVTLEPCSHFGRTPPCSRALIDAGVARVVAAVKDSDSRVSGRGVADLEAAGIPVELELLEREARQLNQAYFHHRETGRPHITLKAAITLDGKIATASGSSRWVSSDESRRHAHKMRAKYGAILCGVGTVLADDPLLTARFPRAPRQPLRIILDSHLHTPVHSKIATTARQFPTIIACTQHADAEKRAAMEQLGIEILPFSADKQERVPLMPIIEALGSRSVDSLLVEGGGEVHAAFVSARLFDRLSWYVAPKLVGGKSAPGPVGGVGAITMDQAIGLRWMSVRRLGPDLFIEAEPEAASPGNL